MYSPAKSAIHRLLFVFILSLLYILLNAQNKIVIKERVEIKPETINYQLSETTGDTVLYPFFTLQYWNKMPCVLATFPIEGYKVKIKWLINIHSECGEDGCCGGDFPLFQYTSWG
jgi:hypothetical protein